MSNWKALKAPNLGLLFNKMIYKEPSIVSPLKYEEKEDALSFDDKKKAEFNDFYNDFVAYNFTDFKSHEILNADHFYLKTTYPGLLLGSGYAHDSNTTGDAKIGFHFDNVLGIPVIPGSSIKGVLKSIFEDERDETTESSLLALGIVIDDILKSEKLNEEEKKWWTLLKNIERFKLEELKNEIFGVHERQGNTSTDVFYDSYITSSHEGKFISTDFITPHNESPLKNPIPLMFIKVLPNVRFKFDFKLKNSASYDGLTIERKLMLYKYILLTIGLGAKTNVGYGQFENVKPPRIVDNELKPEIPQNFNVALLTNATGLVIAISNDMVQSEFIVDNQSIKLVKKRESYFGTRDRNAGNTIINIGDAVVVIEAKIENTGNKITIRKTN